ncbi:MAG: DUF3597 family protein [Sphingomonas sp.]|nr:DUF3597 family protein [Sphingomonas sp.]
MGIFSSIMNKIFHRGSDAAAPAPADAAAAPAADADTNTDTTVAAPAAPAAPVDVGAVLAQIAAEKGDGGNYQSSIVDLLKLLDLDSSLDARKELADELNVHAGDAGTAEQNIALHKAVMDGLAANGGQVPADWRS